MDKKQFKFGLIKWIARVLSLISIGFLSLFVISTTASLAKLGIYDFLLFIFFPTGVALGMVIAWFDELEGSLFSILSLIIFYTLCYIIKRTFPLGPWFLIFTIPAFIFLFFAILNIKIFISKLKCNKNKSITKKKLFYE